MVFGMGLVMLVCVRSIMGSGMWVLWGCRLVVALLTFHNSKHKQNAPCMAFHTEGLLQFPVYSRGQHFFLTSGGRVIYT